MDKVIIFKKIDGGCGIIFPVADMFDAKSDTRKLLGIEFQNDEEILSWIAQKDVPEGLEWYIAEKSNLPTDRYFRDAWIYSNMGGVTSIDISKAKEIHKNKLRDLRKPILEKLDIEYTKASEINNEDKLTEIISKKHQLRDITKLELSDDLEVLKGQIPEVIYS